jgi:DNA-3-methyladenine glycosylase I
MFVPNNIFQKMKESSEPARSRCRWCNPDNALYIDYHDQEWGVAVHDDRKLFEMLVLESFQAGLSWECILNKREAFREAFDEFDFNKIAEYNAGKIESLCTNKLIVRNRRKIAATVNNARVFCNIRKEYGTFDKYIWSFTRRITIFECGKTNSPLSDAVASDLKKRGMKFVGTTIIYSYLQATGIINSHEEGCWLHRQESTC